MARCCRQPAALFSLRFFQLLARFAGAALAGRKLGAEEDPGNQGKAQAANIQGLDLATSSPRAWS